ncbi:hypothetical protein P5V15_002244 [Pogonomyrmex californicus]
MSKKQWLALLLLFLAYLTLGASIFHVIESKNEERTINESIKERIIIYNLLSNHCNGIENDTYGILANLSDYCGKSISNEIDARKEYRRWDFYNSFYFAYTVVSTIGYGNLAPTDTLSRILMIFYGLIGIPMNGILLTQLGEFFSRVFIKAYQKYKSYKNRQSSDYPCKKPIRSDARKIMRLAAQILLYLIPGFIVFIFFPAILFMHYERWTYDQSVYYAFVTLTTIGFGDLVAGQDNRKGNGPFFIMYKIFLICWISFGLGYIVMIMTFIARGMRSKKITRLEHKLAMNLKHTQSKIWNEFNKEVNYLRRVFNELQLSKVKRVYVDEYDYEVPTAKFPRSNSFPNLRDLTIGGYADTYIPHPRRRANSEVVPTDELTHVVSETDLQRIDKNATFAAHAIVQPAELLARLVNILGYIPPRDDFEWDQIEKQTDVQNETQQSKSIDQDLANNVSQWTIGGDKFPIGKPRSRAASEIRLRATKDDSIQNNAEWTWSGVASTKLQELMKDRDATISSKDNANKPYKKFASFALPITAPKNFFPRWRKQFANKRLSDVGPNTRNTEKVVETIDDNEKSNQQNNSMGPLPSYLSERRESILKRPHYYTHTGGDLPNYLEGNNLLEETSLADFLRALTALHAKVGTVPDEYATKPKRKLGTACLSPPKLPSLFTLFSNAPDSISATQSNQNTVTGAQSYQSSRRVSLKLADTNYSGSSTPTAYIRKGSVPMKSRFSLRPVATPVSPPTPSDYESPRLPRLDDRNLQGSISMEPFISVSQKKPLVNMEGLPGISSPIQQPFNTRRFSIRPAQLSTQPSPTSTKSTPTPLHTPKPLPKWKAGMLQRQITQMNLRRRSRASSLSDVYSDKHEKTIAPLSPLAIDNTKTIDVSKSSNQKTVTIMSPAEMNVTRNEFQNSAVIPSDSSRDERTASWRHQEDTVSSTNPFVFGSNEPTAALNESMILNMHKDERYPPRDSLPVYEPVYKSPSSSVFEQKLIKCNDGLDRTFQKGMQETNVDLKEAPLKMEKKQDNIHVYVIDNLSEPREASSASSSSPESKKGKPSVLIDSYKPPLQMTIEKPIINPFEQYRAMTKAAQKGDADLKEVKIEKPK